VLVAAGGHRELAVDLGGEGVDPRPADGDGGEELAQPTPDRPSEPPALALITRFSS
jgi:hypothetical protein